MGYANTNISYIIKNNRMGKTRDIFRKIRHTKGTFHVKMGTVKERNGMNLTEAEHIKRWQEYIEELYKKDLHDPERGEKAMATHSSVLAWRIPGTAEPGGLPSTGSHRVRHD